MKNPTTLSQSANASDAQLAGAACQGNKKAFVEIVSRYQNLVTGVALAILRDFALSEDAAQETFVLAWQKLNTLKDPAKLRPWLAQIARHTALNHAKKKRPTDPLEPSLVDQGPRPDELAISRDEQALVLSALNSLPEKYRLPLVLYYRENQSVGTVAKSLSQSEATVRKQLSRGRNLLKRHIADLFGTGLARTSPGPVFTATVAGLIGAMLKPTAVAATAFSAQPLAATAMTTSKLTLTTAAIITAVCLPVGYTARALIPNTEEQDPTLPTTLSVTGAREPNEGAPSPLALEWQQLLATCHGNPKAFPNLYQAITELPGTLRQDAFLSLLIAEWVRLDPVNGLAFVRNQSDSRWQQELFAKEWIRQDLHAAIDGLFQGGPGWDFLKQARLADIKNGDAWSSLIYSQLEEIIKRAPERFLPIVKALPIHSYSNFGTPFAAYYKINPKGALDAANSLNGRRRELASAGIIWSWSEEDSAAAIAWAESTKDPVLRASLIRIAHSSLVWIDPLQALELLKDSPYDTRSSDQSAIRVLSEKNLPAALSWIAKNPNRKYSSGLQSEFSHRLHEDPLALLEAIDKAGALKATSSILANHAQLREPSQTRISVWKKTFKLKESSGAQQLRKDIISSSRDKDPRQLISLVEGISDKIERWELIKIVAEKFTNPASPTSRSTSVDPFRSQRSQEGFGPVIGEAPQNRHPAVIEAALKKMNPDQIDNSQK